MVLGWERSRPADWIAGAGSAGGEGWENRAAMEDPERRQWCGRTAGRWRRPPPELRAARIMAAAAEEEEGVWKWSWGLA